MGPLTESLCAILAELNELLSAHCEVRWGAWLQRALRRIRAGDMGGVDHLLAAYGGVGSFNDLILHPVNGHNVAVSEVEGVNSQLAALRSRAWEVAHEVRRAAVVE